MHETCFYDSPEYRIKQRLRTLKNQKRGLYTHLKKSESRVCARTGCDVTFPAIASSPKRFCSQSCATITRNLNRKWPEAVRRKISKSMTGKKSPLKDTILVPRSTAICFNPICGRTFTHEQYRTRRFCSNACAMKVTGGMPTSPKASRGKAGIRPDIDPSIYFYSRWEANVARLYNHLGITWEYTPSSFDIGNQIYTPDFYLPERNTYIEVKNFWNQYSQNRDAKFRNRYPDLKLEVIGKAEYMLLEQKYSNVIPLWEFKNTKFPNN